MIFLGLAVERRRGIVRKAREKAAKERAAKGEQPFSIEGMAAALSMEGVPPNPAQDLIDSFGLFHSTNRVQLFLVILEALDQAKDEGVVKEIGLLAGKLRDSANQVGSNSQNASPIGVSPSDGEGSGSGSGATATATTSPPDQTMVSSTSVYQQQHLHHYVNSKNAVPEFLNFCAQFFFIPCNAVEAKYPAIPGLSSAQWQAWKPRLVPPEAKPGIVGC